jgi:L-cysteine desulfidase
MHGDTIPVMSVSGSGNKGLISIIPPAQYGAGKGASQEEVEKSVLLSTLVTMLITYKFGSVSSICGGVYGAGPGAMAGLLYLDKSLDCFFDAFRNYISSICGIFCDGAKGSCALKATPKTAFWGRIFTGPLKTWSGTMSILPVSIKVP